MSIDFKQFLKTRGLKATPARLGVLVTLHETMQPLRIEDIHERMTAPVDLATVYRIVNALVAAGAVAKVDFGERGAYFEPTDRTHHHHLVCTHCGRVVDIAYCPAHLEQTALAAARGFARIDRHSLELFGVCKRCAT